MDVSLPPNESGIEYTIPTIQLPSGEWITESLAIAHRLEQQNPQRSLRIDSPNTDVVIKLTEKIMYAVLPDFVPKVPKRLLADASLEYWYRTRQEWFGGIKLDDLERRQGGHQVYQKARADIKQLGEMLQKVRSGPFFEGDTPTYADFVWVSFLYFYEKLGDDIFQKLVGEDYQPHLALLEACRPWFSRHDQ